MALQTARLRRVVTSLSSLHRSFYFSITASHSPLSQISISDSPSVQPSPSFRFQSRPFSTPWYCPWKDDEDPKAENDDDDVSLPSKEGDSEDKSDPKNFLTKEEIIDLVLSNMKDVNTENMSKEEIEELVRNRLQFFREEAAKEAAAEKEREEAAALRAKENGGDSKDSESKEEEDDGWVFSLDDLGKEDGGDLFKNVKPLSEYDVDSKLTNEDRSFMDIFKKYDIKAMMAKAKEQEEKEAEENKEYEGYNFMRRRQEEYPFNFFEDEEPRVPKNEDDIMEIFAGCDLKHWLITVDFPDDPEPKPEEKIATYERVCAEGLGISIEEAKKRIYACSTTVYDGFQVECTKEESEKFVEVPEVLLILPDSYMDRKNEQYGGDKYDNGVITLRPPKFSYKKKAKKGAKKDNKGEKKDNKGGQTSDKMKMARPLPPPPQPKQGANP